MRLITGQFLHADDFHLYYNMASLLYKGVTLKRRWNDFCILVTVLLLATGLIHTFLAFVSVRNESESRFLLHYCRGILWSHLCSQDGAEF